MAQELKAETVGGSVFVPLMSKGCLLPMPGSSITSLVLNELSYQRYHRSTSAPPGMRQMQRRSKVTVLVVIVVVVSCVMVFFNGGINDIHNNPHIQFEKKQALGQFLYPEQLETTVLITPRQQSSKPFQVNRNLASITRSGQFKVVILTYMRSGSSLTGDIVQQHPDVFYVFEPLWSTDKVSLGLIPESSYRRVDNTILSVPRTRQDMTTRYIQVVNSFLNCHLEQVDVVTLTQYFMKYSLSTSDFLKCAHDVTNLTRITVCLKPLNAACQNSRAVVLKVIRPSFENLIYIFKADPQVRVIHLIRDPRGTIKSQLQVGAFKWRDLTKSASDLCLRIKNDIFISRHLSQNYPDRILTVRYEDITEFPLATTKTIYKFLNLSISSEIEKYIWNITYGGYPDGCNICTNRSNATQTEIRWRVKLPFMVVQEIQRECQNLFKIMGYTNFNSKKELRNLRLKSHQSFYMTDGG